MKHKFISSSIALVLALSLCLVTAVPVAAASEVFVDDSYTTPEPPYYLTIQEGITAVDPGGIVNVAAGTYEESFEINKCLTLVSTEGPENTKIDVPSGTGIEIKASFVTVEGFKVSGDGLHYGIIVRKGEGVEILNNVVTGTTKHGAIELYGNLVAVTVSGNTIDSCAYGIVVGDVKFSISDSTISNNTITGSTGGNWGAIPFCGEISNITINGNEISNNEGMNGILFGSGIYKNIVVENNTVSSNLNGVEIKANADFTNLAINHNNICGNDEYGILNDSTVTVDATNNWWGDASGPYHTTNPDGLGNAVSDNVLFDPWLKSPYSPVIEVEIDIKPGSDPNSINLKSKGVVPVAVLTTEDFDAATVDPDTVLFADASPVRSTLEDVDGDGKLDMLFHFKTQELGLDEDSTEATLTGQTLDGIDIVGTDTVNIVPKGKGPK